jgi:hypothetical protein
MAVISVEAMLDCDGLSIRSQSRLKIIMMLYRCLDP